MRRKTELLDTACFHVRSNAGKQLCSAAKPTYDENDKSYSFIKACLNIYFSGKYLRPNDTENHACSIMDPPTRVFCRFHIKMDV